MLDKPRINKMINRLPQTSSAQSGPPLASTGEGRVLCKFYNGRKGSCRYEENCRFLHIERESPEECRAKIARQKDRELIGRAMNLGLCGFYALLEVRSKPLSSDRRQELLSQIEQREANNRFRAEREASVRNEREKREAKERNRRIKAGHMTRKDIMEVYKGATNSQIRGLLTEATVRKV